MFNFILQFTNDGFSDWSPELSKLFETKTKAVMRVLDDMFNDMVNVKMRDDDTHAYRIRPHDYISREF